MAIDRRAFLKSGAASVALVSASALGGVASGCAGVAGAHPGARPRKQEESPFLHGVASGDPLADRVILWTRVSPLERRLSESLRVGWRIARDPELTDVVARGTQRAVADRDFTVKVDAAGLEPGRDYWYAFECEGMASPTGRTRTLPTTRCERVRFAVVSCSNFPQGFFNAYAAIAAREDLDAVLHLGDYLYEYGNGEYGDGRPLGRVPDPVHEILTLEDYRRRHGQYKTDPDLQAAHARHPWITIWDDHESANDSWKDGAENHTESAAPGVPASDPKAKGRGEGPWRDRRLAAIRAYQEWMPIRELPTGLFREFRFGELVDLVMLDTRLHGRDARAARGDERTAADPARSLLGEDQTNWLLEALTSSKRADTRWRVIGQQVVFSAVKGAFGEFNADAWDGYRANRQRILDHLEREAIGNVVVLTGDVHSAWALDGSRVVELVAPAVSSPPFGSHPQAAEMVRKALPNNPQIRHSNVLENGFVLVDLTRDRARAEFYASESVKRRSALAHARAVFDLHSGATRLTPVALGRA